MIRSAPDPSTLTTLRRASHIAARGNERRYQKRHSGERNQRQDPAQQLAVP